ncbi:hypothetical protein BH23ACT10_BH23ACT10_23210 [soil metagenome]
MSPEGAGHVHVIDMLNEILVSALIGRYRVRIGHPIALGDLSEPEPDVAVVELDDYLDGHPQAALLVIETSYPSRRRDLGFKASLYARHGIPEYGSWISRPDRSWCTPGRRRTAIEASSDMLRGRS